jgi:hypothetical protein
MKADKSQQVRLIDIFLIAPFLVYIGYKAKGINKTERSLLYVLGISTLIYNANNYLKNNNDQ